MKQNMFKSAVKWLGIVILAHLASALLFGLFLSGSVGSLSVDEPAAAAGWVFGFNVVFDIVFAVLYCKIETSYVDYRKALKEAVKESNISSIAYFKQNILKEHLIKCGVFLVFQLPFLIFYAAFGMSLTQPLVFETFYVMDAGSYLLTGSAILGVLLNTLVFALIYTCVRLLFVFITRKDVEQDIIR